MSTEEERAAYYEQHKDDPEVWGEAIEAPEPQGRRTLRATVTIRLTEEEATLVREQAKRLGQTYSDVIRTAILDMLQPRFSIEQGGSAGLVFNDPWPPIVRPEVEIDPALKPTRTTFTQVA